MSLHSTTITKQTWKEESSIRTKDLDGHDRYMVESILDHWRNRGGLQYLAPVKWVGYFDATWDWPEAF